ncbi:hypothetical protein FRB99_002759 [Tulasnella sp. 403]|nr:hypothetical protein FRB99_002759 [Tulasnella sp. 403]
MQYIPGTSVTLSASLSYLAKMPLPDDSDVQTRIPQICVDYLSHEWLEEDVWKSWRNMTRHKNEVANGVRLENASWRTWWKQRNKLKTVSPETLNWLKDSDVTWLYGPLHTAAEPVPPPKQSTTEERFNLVKPSGLRPILKHRTITELLHIHANDQHLPPAIGSPAIEAVGMDFSASPSRDGSPRPTLPHTHSDTHLPRVVGSTSPPPRVTLQDPPPRDSPTTSRAMSPAHSDSLAGSISNLALSQPAKRHISFNKFVEQCISIDDPAPNDPHGPPYDSDDQDAEDDDSDDSSVSSVLEMHSTPSVGSRSRDRGPTVRSNSTSQERERMTIAPIPPTVLKTTEEFPAPSPQVVYAPPQGFVWDPTHPEFSSESSTGSGSSDNLSNALGSITGQPLDLGFVPPQWGRASAAPGTVGKGNAGPVGPADLFQSNVYNGYQEPAKVDTSALPGATIGMHAGRSKWVPNASIPDDDDEENVPDDMDEPAEDSDASAEADRIARVARHSAPIGIPKTSISHPPPPPAPNASNPLHMPPTATMSSTPGASAGFLSPSQSEAILFGTSGSPSTGRGRTVTRSASSSGISDRSRSSSKLSGTSSPIGSVSPSGYGSPSGSRAPSVLGNRRSSTDVGLGRSTAAGVSPRNGLVGPRQTSTSPPAVSSPLANSSIPASSLGTIVANVPLETPISGPSERRPPMARSGITSSKLQAVTNGIPQRPRVSRASSTSSVSSSGSSGSSSGTANATRTPRSEVRVVLPAAPPTAVTAPLPVPVKKPGVSVVLPQGEPRPTVITSPQTPHTRPAEAGEANGLSSTTSSAGQSPSGGMLSLEARDSKLEEEMRKVKAAQQLAQLHADLKAPKPNVVGVQEGGSNGDGGKLSNPTPSNSPVLGMAKNEDGKHGSTSTPTPTISTHVKIVGSPNGKASPVRAVITPSLVSASTLTPTDENGMVGKAADTLVSGAKGLLGAIWGMGEGATNTR